ncbi:MAG: AEC family transporter [Candidatus Margulisbacteria bacterium]|nr:AEC family transporter [Candidatus Margulisiibacteriota bacterium]
MTLIPTILILSAWTFLGFLSGWQKWFPKQIFFILNKIVFILLLPLFIFVSTVNNFNYNYFLSNIIIIFGQCFFVVPAALLVLFFYSRTEKKFVFNILAFQNAGYLPLPVLLAFPNNHELLLLLFLFLVGFNLIIFSLGYWIMNKKTHISEIINPPITATILSFALVIADHFFTFLPDAQSLQPLLAPLAKIISILFFPILFFVFGGFIADQYQHLKNLDLILHLKISISKYLLFPLLVIMLKPFVSADIFTILFIQSLMPPAMNLLTIPEKEKDILTMNNYLFAQYLVFILLVIPAFLVIQWLFK